MLRVSNISVPLDFTEEDALNKVLKRLRIGRQDVRSFSISKRSVDSRDKGDVHFVVAVDVQINGDEGAVLKHLKPGEAVAVPKKMTLPAKTHAPLLPPVVIGLGPGGLFAALALARAGACPIVLERGEDVDSRAKSVHLFQTQRTLNEESNIQFGEGGAGAFSDGKLTTGIKDKRCQIVLDELVAHGAPEDILTSAHPHIGTDRLPQVVKAIRQEIVQLGGKVLFSARAMDLLQDKGGITHVIWQDQAGQHTLRADIVVLAIGHSAYDTQQMLFSKGLTVVPKPFSVGVRIEHLQRAIDKAQYGAFAGDPHLPPAEYHLSCKLKDGRGAYTFCMCPGGQVVAAASKEGGVCTNGMSPYARDGINANAALLIDVLPQDFGDTHPLAGFTFQRMLEKRAYQMGGCDYSAPAQRVQDFLKGVPTKQFGEVNPSYLPAVVPCDLTPLFPAPFADDLKQALALLDGRMRGFCAPDAVLTAVETRSSCPVRIVRDKMGQSSLRGLFPVGEGAGYAGGIMSAATDGLRAAENVLALLSEGTI